MRASTHVGALATGLLAFVAAADLPGTGASPFVSVTSSTGFVPVTWSEPTNGIGFGGGDRHGGSGPVPFAGWVDFGLLGDPSVTVEWDFTVDVPSRWLEWSIVRLNAQDTPLAGVSWDGGTWGALGDLSRDVGAAGTWTMHLGELPQPGGWRLRFRGVTEQPEGVASPSISYTVPAPGAAALVVTAAWVARRRRS